jgi:hypothetical protein
MDLQQLVSFLVKCLSSKSGSSSANKLRETALLLADAAAEQLCNCQPLVASLSSCLTTLLIHLDSTDAMTKRTGMMTNPPTDMMSSKQGGSNQPPQQPSTAAVRGPARGSSAGGGGSSAGGSSNSIATAAAQQLRRLACRLLEKMLLLAPTNFTALDCLPQLCTVLLGPAASHCLLYQHRHCSSACGGSSGGSCGSSALQEGPAGVAGKLQDVLGMARQMAAAVSPR